MNDRKNQEPEHSRLVVDGNAFYELDLDCVRCREARRKTQAESPGKTQNPKEEPTGQRRI